METEKQCLEVGYWVALTLAPDTAPLDSYVGEVQAVEERGIRITLIDWLSGGASGFDLYVPWSHIVSALVCTPEHALELFGEECRSWQGSVSAMRHPESAGEQGEL